MADTPANAELVRRYAAAMAADVALPVAFRSGEGCRIEDEDGNQYIDFIGGFGVVNTGYQRPEVLAALSEQLRTACFAPPWMPTRAAAELAEELLSLAPPSVRVCARASGGADANEVAIKAHFALRGGTVLVVGLAYHGGTTRMLAASDSQAFGLPPSPAAPPPRVPPAYCYRCPYGKTYPACSLECAEAVEKAAATDPAISAVFLEPIIGSGGVIVPPPAYFGALQDICRRRGLALILDEVMTGCGRVGAFLAAEAFGLRPDAITLAKGLGGGYATIGAALLSPELADSLTRHEDVSATLAWTPLACAAALANLRLLRAENLARRAAETGARLHDRIREVFERVLPEHVGEVRGKGLLIGVELVADRSTKKPAPHLMKRIALRCFRAGLMVGTSWDWRVLILAPPLVLDDATTEEALDILESVLRRVARAVD
jgi:4-aminobutyrate aminotransferase-like enzyme